MIGLRRQKDTVDTDPQQLAHVEERIALIQQLKRKYGDTIADVLAYAQRIQEELYHLEHREERLLELQTQLNEMERQLLQEAAVLTRARQQLANTLTPRIQQQLNELQLENFQFQIRVHSRAADNAASVDMLDANGMDDVQFLVAPNGTTELLPLAKVASGGELSRLMLALKTVESVSASSSDDAPTIVFDEIDTGVSGQSALAVAEKLLRLSRQHQVLCISHQPQVVSMADTHFWVQKETSASGVVTSQVQPLQWEERVQALARMMEGDRLSPLTIAHAENMLRRAQQQKSAMEKEG